MPQPKWRYRPPELGPLQLRESVRRPLLALAGDNPPEARLELGRIEEVERALRCELPDEILACFANGDATLREWGFDLGAVVDHTALARELECRASVIGVGEDPNGGTLYCVERRGDRHRAVGLLEVSVEENGEVGWRDLGSWLAEVAGLDSLPRPQSSAASVQLTFWPDEAAQPRVWRLVTRGSAGRAFGALDCS